MKQTRFNELMASAREALDHAQGKRVLRTTVLPDPPAPLSASEIRDARERVSASQAVFAHYLNVSTKLVQAWEAGRRSPDGPALRLLRIGQEHPELVFAAPSAPDRPRPSTPAARKRAAKRAPARQTARRPARKR
ncbi:MAG: helix-turn-helix domain-containing protein [Gemmatimonadales bacterium]